MKQYLIILLTFCCVHLLHAQSFDQYFEDATLRLDYIFAGNAKEQHIYLQELKRQEKWAGRKSRLAEKFLNGNGQVTVRDHATQQVIYVSTFSTLFQEWLQYDEAKRVDKAFETSYNVPFPKKSIDVTVTLTNNHQAVTAEMTHTVDPKDILIRKIGNNGIPFYYVWKPSNAQKDTPSRPSAANEPRSGKGRNYTASEYDPFSGVDITGCIDLAIVAEGYTEAQMGKFYHDSQRAVDALFEREPFKSLKNRFNVVAVAAPSREAGPTVPHLGIWHTTPAGSHYDTFYTDRYLMSQDMHRIYDLLSGVPFEHIMVLVNSDTYGGGGIYNQVTFSTSDHPTFKEVFVHEFGHSYAGLADEYAYDDMDSEWYPADTEPWEPNITTLHDFAAKWQDMLPGGTPVPTPPDELDKQDVRRIWNTFTPDQKALLNLKLGVYEGAGYQTKGVFRPVQECRMRINECEEFCPVCERAIVRMIDYYTR